MEKSKKRPRQKRDTNDGPRKKTKRNEQETAPSEMVTVKAEVNDAHPGEVDPHGDLSTTINEWLQQQTCEASMLAAELLDASAAEEEENEEEDGDEMEEILENLEVKIRDKLKGLTKEQKEKRFKFECEWKKCAFMSGDRRKYFEHVEQHAEAMEEQDGDRYECEWDLCDFRTDDYSHFIGHVHFHAYHTKVKVFGASMSMLMKYPTCNNDSQTRNNISDQQTSYTCEWEQCEEKFNKALIFYHHVACHIKDVFPPGRKTLIDPIFCRWSNCKQEISKAKWAIVHSQMHTKQKTIGCFNCGTMFKEQIRYRDHCNRQLDLAYRHYQCEECDKYFSTKRLLNAHASLHKFPHSCTFCPRKFNTKSVLAVHIRRVHLKIKPIACSKCEYRTYTKTELDKHVGVHHTTRKLFRCNEFNCNATFKFIESLKKHIIQHYNIPPPRYGCHFCPSEYKESWKLSKHLSFVHKVERDPGTVRFQYKVDTDGMNRLSSYVDSRRKLSAGKIPSVTSTRDSDSKEDATEPTNGEDASATLPKDAGPVGKTKINSMSMIGKHEVAIELGLEFAKNADELSSQEVPVLENVRIINDEHEQPRLVEKKKEKKTKKPKKVQEFTVMQRYLKGGKMVESSE